VRYFLDLSYIGTNYHGWQIQENAISIQQILEKSLSTFLGEDIKTLGSGRTDTGVHALSQIVHFDSKKMLDNNFIYKICKKLFDSRNIKTQILQNAVFCFREKFWETGKNVY